MLEELLCIICDAVSILYHVCKDNGSAKSRLVCSANDKKTRLVLTFIVFSLEAEWEKRRAE